MDGGSDGGPIRLSTWVSLDRQSGGLTQRGERPHKDVRAGLQAEQDCAALQCDGGLARKS